MVEKVRKHFIVGVLILPGAIKDRAEDDIQDASDRDMTSAYGCCTVTITSSRFDPGLMVDGRLAQGLFRRNSNSDQQVLGAKW